MCQFSSCHPCDESSHELFQQLSSEAAAAVQGGYWAYHLDHAHSTPLVSSSHYSSDFAYGGPKSSFSSPPVSPVEKSISTYGYSYGYGTDF